MALNYEVRYSAHPDDVKYYDTQQLREHFVFEEVMEEGNINLVYSNYDRFISGGAVPTNIPIILETIDPLKASYFLERREMGVINIGGNGIVKVDGKSYAMGYKEALYIGKGCKEVVFESVDASNPAKYYINSTPAHATFPTKHITLADAQVINAGSPATSNDRIINKLIVHGVVDTCQLQMGLTELKSGSVWNTMPAHVHDRRMEVYFYFNIPAKEAVSHFMGEPQETRHIWLHNEQAVISPNWSIHSGCGTSNYCFIWGMAGENVDYTDMDGATAEDLL